MTAIIDTNIILIANRQHQEVSSQCIETCSMTLQSLMQKGRIALDDGFRILTEYQSKTQPKKGKGPGDIFVKWALQNNANPARCDRVPIIEHRARGFKTFPDDAELANFDAADRKFVAVAVSHQSHPPILQAADSKWLAWAPSLKRHGVHVKFLCESDIKRFRKKKTKK